MASTPSGPRPDLEKVPAGEEAQIDSIAQLTVQQLDRRYANAPRVLRGVHPKDHGCVEATFTVNEDLPEEYRVGVFALPGQKYYSMIRFSNAAPLVTPDSLELGPDGKPAVAHGSRGMAIKLYHVWGQRLAPNDGEKTQDFLMINQPVFAFANVEDYQALSEILVQDQDNPRRWFARMGSPDPAVAQRARATMQIVQRVKSQAFPPAFQAPPLSPFDNRYFSAAPFGFGEGRVMKFAATPVNPMTGELGDKARESDYLRAALAERLRIAAGKDICFDFQVQVRDVASFAGRIENDIENASALWDEAQYPFVTVGRITIGQQDPSAPERRELCETLFYTPWHGIQEHRPLGGINRMRQKVYDASAGRRGCPVSPEPPALAQRDTTPAARRSNAPWAGTQSPPGKGGRRR